MKLMTLRCILEFYYILFGCRVMKSVSLGMFLNTSSQEIDPQPDTN